MYDRSKLRGLIAEKGFSISSLADHIDISRANLNDKMNNKLDFREKDIHALIVILEIKDIEKYFFKKIVD